MQDTQWEWETRFQGSQNLAHTWAYIGERGRNRDTTPACDRKKGEIDAMQSKIALVEYEGTSFLQLIHDIYCRLRSAQVQIEFTSSQSA